MGPKHNRISVKNLVEKKVREKNRRKLKKSNFAEHLRHFARQLGHFAEHFKQHAESNFAEHVRRSNIQNHDSASEQISLRILYIGISLNIYGEKRFGQDATCQAKCICPEKN